MITKKQQTAIVEYVISIKIQATILQSIAESSGKIDFNSMSDLSLAVASDTIHFLTTQGLIKVGGSDDKDN